MTCYKESIEHAAIYECSLRLVNSITLPTKLVFQTISNSASM